MHNLRRRFLNGSSSSDDANSSADSTLSTDTLSMEMTSLAPTEAQQLAEELRMLVRDGLAVDSVEIPREPAREGKIVLRGRLRQPSYEVFPQWLAALKLKGYTPTLRLNDEAPASQIDAPVHSIGQAVILRVMPGVPPKHKPRVWINALLFVVTLLSTLFVGVIYSPDIVEAETALGFIAQNFWRGWPFAASLLGILAAHEFGHYFAARYHKVAVTLPFFIPMPLTPIGTLGAFIQLKEPIADRRKLFDVGVAGPLAGVIVAIPLLFIGLATADTAIPVPVEGGFSVGNNLFYWLAKYITFGRPLPDPITGETIVLNQVTFASWIGLFVTALNLLPLGQLDGGHTVFALFGSRARLVNIGAAVVMGLFAFAGLGFVQEAVPALARVGYNGWFLWLGLIFFIIGPFHPPALDDVTTLNRGRRWVGYSMIVIFVLTFAPVPFRIY